MRRVSTVAVMAASALAGAALVAGPAGAADGPRGYEKVTPGGKGAGTVQSVDTFRANEDGSRFLLSTSGPFASVPSDSIPLYTRYLAARGPAGWGLTGTDAPTDAMDPITEANVMSTVLSSDDLSHVLVVSNKALAPGAIEGGGNMYVRNTATRAYALVAASPDVRFAREFLNNQGNYSVKYVANDGRSAVFGAKFLEHPDAPEPPPGADGSVGYRWTAERGLEVATVLPDGTPTFGALAGGGDEVGARSSIPRSGGAERIFFAERIPTEGTGADPGPIYVREGSVTRLVSWSRINPSDPPAQGGVGSIVVSADTRFAVISVQRPPWGGPSARLTSDAPADLDESVPQLYRYDAVLDELRYVGASSRGPVGISDDGSTIAFRHMPTNDGMGMHVWKDGVVQTVYVRDVDRGNGSSTTLRMLSPNGRYLVFSDESPSLAAQFGFDTSGSPEACHAYNQGGTPGLCQQVYRFDTEAPDPASALVCVSCRTDGKAPRGHAGDPTVKEPGYIRMDAHQMRMAFDDGRVLFTSPDDLVRADNNGLPDVYEYRNGERTLLSRGAAGHGARLLDASRDGSSVFFSTDDRISAWDEDAALDVYVLRPDARPDAIRDLGAVPCSGADCRSAAPAPIGPVVAGSERTGEPRQTGRAKPAAKPRVTSARVAGSGRVTVRVRVSDSGRIVVSGSGVRRVARQVAGGSTYTVRTSLTKAQRSKVRRSRKAVRVTLRVLVSPDFGSSRVLSVSRRAGV